MNLLTLGFKKEFNEIYEKNEWSDLKQKTQLFIENNLLYLTEWFFVEEDTPPQNLAEEFIGWCFIKNKPPYTEKIHSRPIFLMEFLSDIKFNKGKGPL